MPISAATIVGDALAIAKCPGFTSQGGRALNLVLADLVQHRNLKVNLTSSQIPLSVGNIGPYNLESDYLRTYEMKYVLNGETYVLNPASLSEYDSDYSQSLTTGYPSEYATNLSVVPDQGYGWFYVLPGPNAPITVTHRYFVYRPDIATPETSQIVPWFSDQDYLVQAVAMRMMRITDDARYDDYVARCEQMIRLHLVTEGDEQQVVKSVQLDPRRFRVAGGARPTKLDPF